MAPLLRVIIFIVEVKAFSLWIFPVREEGVI
jgi:hypothetical protein